VWRTQHPLDILVNIIVLHVTEYQEHITVVIKLIYNCILSFFVITVTEHDNVEFRGVYNLCYGSVLVKLNTAVQHIISYDLPTIKLLRFCDWASNARSAR
jgi:hypothetical protein